jgi:hypothetical protein
MPISLRPGKGWRATWKENRAKVDSSTARAGARFAAAWFNLCQCEESVLVTYTPKKEGRNAYHPMAARRANRCNRASLSLEHRLVPQEPRRLKLFRSAINGSAHGALSHSFNERVAGSPQPERSRAQELPVHEAHSSNLDELRSLDISVTGFGAADGRLGGRSHAARACQGHGNN